MIDRRKLIGASVAAAGVAVLGLPSTATAFSYDDDELTPHQSLARLMAGNLRWVHDRMLDRRPTSWRRRQVAEAQHPKAVVFSCIDSRVPPEYVFDQDLGEVFVVRTAAHALDPMVLGCIEYGPAHGVPLVFVMGHTRCGAIQATVEAIEDGVHHPGNLPAIIAALTPAYYRAAPTFQAHWSREQRVNAIVTAQIELATGTLRNDPLLVDTDTLIVGGRYSLDTGRVSLVN
jgi:carbonic anhydrase